MMEGPAGMTDISKLLKYVCPAQAAADGDDESKPAPKAKNPLDALPPSKMMLDSWKRLYSNTPAAQFRQVAIKGLWDGADIPRSLSNEVAPDSCLPACAFFGESTSHLRCLQDAKMGGADIPCGLSNEAFRDLGWPACGLLRAVCVALASLPGLPQCHAVI